MEPGWRERWHCIIFEADTPAGKTFDVALLVAILASLAVVMLDSVQAIHDEYATTLLVLEWSFTLLFSVEYVLRLVTVRRPLHYARSFYGVVDLLSIVPTYLSLVINGSQSLIVIRSLRLVRAFRVLKLAKYLGEAQMLSRGLRASRHKITVFLVTVLCLVVIVGATMFLVEGPAHGFSSIPLCMYWAIVTMTTVGYGDIVPETVLGRTLASILMVVGYGIIAVPTGIVTAEMVQLQRHEISTRACRACGCEDHDKDAVFCKQCGAKLDN